MLHSAWEKCAKLQSLHSPFSAIRQRSQTPLPYCQTGTASRLIKMSLTERASGSKSWCGCAPQHFQRHHIYIPLASPPYFSAFLLFTQTTLPLQTHRYGTTMADVGVNDGGGGAGGGAAGGGQARRVVDALGQVVRGRFTDFLQTFRVRVYVYNVRAAVRAAAFYEWASVSRCSTKYTTILTMHSPQDIPSLPLPRWCCTAPNPLSPHLQTR